MTTKFIAILLALCLVNATVSQKLFRCFYYFDKTFVSFNLKDLYLEDKSSHLEYTYNNNGVPGKLFVNVCDAIEIPEQCNQETTSNIFNYFFLDYELKI